MVAYIVSMVEIFATTRVSPEKTARLLKEYYPDFAEMIAESCIELFEKDKNDQFVKHWQKIACILNLEV